jgi:excinuclease ABC subunit B
VEFGFRLPSALDNRPLNFEEFEERVHQAVYVSATPGDYELKKAEGVVVEQIIRPTGLDGPPDRGAPGQRPGGRSFGRTAQGDKAQRAHPGHHAHQAHGRGTDRLPDRAGPTSAYLHSDIKTIERVEILQDLRRGVFDVLVGINLLREGLDLPEVSLVAILDADREGFLRSTRSLIQTTGRAARNVGGKVILYADKVTDSMARAIEETERRREAQEEFNREHKITPTTIKKKISAMLPHELASDYSTVPLEEEPETAPEDIPRLVARLRKEMMVAADDLRFEEAALLRDQIKELEAEELKWRG